MDRHRDYQTRDFVDGHSPSKVRVFEQEAGKRFRAGRIGRGWSTAWATVYLVLGIAFAVLAFNYLAAAGRDAKPLPAPTPTAAR